LTDKLCARAKRLLQSVGLAHKLQNTPSELSAGEQQRVAIARALVNNPAVVFMDEPTGNLDRENMANVMKLVGDLNEVEKRTFILTTHSSAAAEFAPKIFYLRDGRLSESV
jgi:ABC-type lipoprotein export system ATPase subunit